MLILLCDGIFFKCGFEFSGFVQSHYAEIWGIYGFMHDVRNVNCASIAVISWGL
jgi:hypothetical protein